MDPLTLSLILGGVGALKGVGPDQWKEDRERWSAAQTQRFSPWTGLRAGAINEADPLGNALQGGVQGFSMGQNIQAHNKKMAAPAAPTPGEPSLSLDQMLEQNPELALSSKAGQAGPTTVAAKRLNYYAKPY